MQTDDVTAETAETAETVTAMPAEAPDDLLGRVVYWFDRVWDFELFPIDGKPVLVSTLVIALLVLIIGLLLARIVSRYVGRVVLPKLRLSRGPASAVQSIIYYLLVAAVAMVALQMAGMPLTVFTIFGGAVALGVGFGSQNIVNNFISGLILLIERPVAVGQLVEVDGLMGVVNKVGARSTVLTGYKGTDYIVPNSMLLERAVTNWNFTHSRIRSEVEVGVAYGSDTKRVRELLLEAAGRVDGVHPEPGPSVLFKSFGDSALVFELSYWAVPGSVIERLQMESAVRFEIDALFREAGVVISFPQQDVHLDSDRPLEVRVVGS